MYIGVANLPNQRHKVVSRKGACLNLMLVGESGSGKTTFLNTLFASVLKEPTNHSARFESQLKNSVTINWTRAEVEEKGFSLLLSVAEVPGFGDYINNAQCADPIVSFVDAQHAKWMKAEKSLASSPQIVDGSSQGNVSFNRKEDLRIHACIYFIQPTGHSLKPIDVHVMKQLCTRVNLIPVISKADSIAPADLAAFKERIKEGLFANGIQIFTLPATSDDEDTTRRNQGIMSAMPFAVIASDTDVLVKGEKVRGRQYLWGVAEVENEAHCDFKKLRNLLIRTHMLDLITSTNEVHYEAFRVAELASQGVTDDTPSQPSKLSLESKMKDEEATLRARFTEQVRVEEARFRKWEQKLILERDRLNKDLEDAHRDVKNLQEIVDELALPSSKRGKAF